MRNFILMLLLALPALQVASAQEKSPVNKTKGKALLEGYDAVSYFNGKPQKGNLRFELIAPEGIYWFSTLENKQKFEKMPSKYKPQYGGWCAYAMGEKGEKVEVDPLTFKISDNKLYLFYHDFFTNTLNYWNKDEQQLRRKADENWAQILMKTSK